MYIPTTQTYFILSDYFVNLHFTIPYFVIFKLKFPNSLICPNPYLFIRALLCWKYLIVVHCFQNADPIPHCGLRSPYPSCIASPRRIISFVIHFQALGFLLVHWVSHILLLHNVLLCSNFPYNKTGRLGGKLFKTQNVKREVKQQSVLKGGEIFHPAAETPERDIHQPIRLPAGYVIISRFSDFTNCLPGLGGFW